MKEKLLQFIWQFQYFNSTQLTTSDNEILQILDPGKINHDQGPDFREAKIKINNTTWIGNIEIHIKAGSWYLHNHHNDNKFNNIILHVVWENDVEVRDQYGIKLPTLTLQERVSKILLKKYEFLMHNEEFIPCGSQINTVNKILLFNWKERLLIERLQNKSAAILECQAQNNNHWEETFWWQLSKNFGNKVNGYSFELVARSLPVKILSKHKNQIHQLESLLLGQAGMLTGKFNEDYPSMLQKEYLFLRKKYGLKQVDNEVLLLRMRPANFPAIRLAQLAMLISQSEHLFSKMIRIDEAREARKLLNVTANDYWHYHYVLDNESAYKLKSVGEQMVNNIMINTIVPMIFAYGLFNKEQLLIDKSVNWLQECAPEQNRITKGFAALSLENKNSFDSQSMLQLKNEYCAQKKCLNCAIGNAIIKSDLVF